MANATRPCGCCKGTEALTPQSVANRPGLTALSYRCGTHATFLETMRARLSNPELGSPGERESDRTGQVKTGDASPLRGLTTRDLEDPSIALLDAWASVADVLTFYQERIANEGYLRTATERRSVLELARLVGYTLRPGVAASVHLALELDKDHDVLIPPHKLKAQSVPGPGEHPQIFENIEPIEARHTWNTLRPRLTRPQTLESITQGQNLSPAQPRLYIKGISSNLKPNDVVLITAGGPAEEDNVYHVAEAKPDPPNDRTLVTFQEAPTVSRAQRVMGDTSGERARPFAEVMAPSSGASDSDPLKSPMVGMTKRPSVPPRNALSLRRDVDDLARTFGPLSDTGLQLVGAFNPGLRRSLPAALANVKVTPDTDVHAYVFRAVARPFGHNAPPRPVMHLKSRINSYTSYAEWEIDDPLGQREPGPEAPAVNGHPHPRHDANILYLDGEYKIQSGGWIIIEGSSTSASSEPLFLNLEGPEDFSQVSLTAYGISGKSTRLKLRDGTWLKDPKSFTPVRETIVYCESEELPLAEEPIEKPVCDGVDDPIELEGLHSGLQAGRWLIVAGERDDIMDNNNNKISGVKAAELVMLGEVNQTVNEISPQDRAQYSYGYGPSGPPGDKTHTFIKLARELQYCYRRDTVSIHANVVKATHGESRAETLGSGDTRRAFQSFPLKQPPLTFVASPTPAGAESTLEVYVNDVRWREVVSLVELNKNDQKCITKTDDEGRTIVVFGDGQHGARLPTGMENIRAEYRSGIGRVGNMPAEQISQLVSKPLGVRGVINHPLRASGGADKESRDTARKNAPLTVTALDRLVSVSDYADFARTFAGIGKAVAARINDRQREWVHVTIAGADDIPIDETSDLYRNLLQALRDCGDPHQPVALQVRELMLLVVSANVRILSDHQWEPVAKAIRDKLYDIFSFEQRELGQDVWLSEVIAAMQSVKGVAYVDVDVLGGIPEKEMDQERRLRRLRTPQEIAVAAIAFIKPGPLITQPQARVAANLADFEEGAMLPAQLAYLTPAVADTLVLNQVLG